MLPWFSKFLVKCIVIMGMLSALAFARNFREKRQLSDEELLFRQICMIGDGLYKHPFMCGKFLDCNKGEFKERDCPPMMNFDLDSKSCEARYRLKCTVVDGVTEYQDLRPKKPTTTPVSTLAPNASSTVSSATQKP